MTIFNEKTLQDEIHRVWGAYGAHADVYAHILRSNADMLETLEKAREYIMSEAEKRNYAPAVPLELVADMDYAIAKAKGKT